MKYALITVDNFGLSRSEGGKEIFLNCPHCNDPLKRDHQKLVDGEYVKIAKNEYLMTIFRCKRAKALVKLHLSIKKDKPIKVDKKSKKKNKTPKKPKEILW